MLGWDVYFSTCPARAPGGTNARIKAADAACIPALFIDFDTQQDESKRGKKLPHNAEQAIAALDALPCPPTVCVCSGHGVHAYWILEEPLRINVPADLDAAKTLLKRFACAVASATGFTDLDTGASEPARVLRVPGTLNLKRGGALPVYVVNRPEGPEHPLDQLRVFIEQASTDPSPNERRPYVLPPVILDGDRDNELTRYAGSLRARGLEYDAILEALHQANEARCRPPKDAADVERIARSVMRYPAGPSRPTAEEDFGPGTIDPEDFSDVGNARAFASLARGRAAFTGARGYLAWDGACWREDEQAALAMAMGFTDTMRANAAARLTAARVKLTQAQADGTDQLAQEADREAKDALAYLKHAQQTRKEPRIRAILNLAKPALGVPPELLDADPFTLNTPAGLVDLRTGAIRPHDPGAWCTCITAVSPSEEGRKLWEDHVRLVTCGDTELARFLQLAAGMALLGRVFVESLLIALGDGRNGKSSFFNALLQVLGPGYAGTISPEVLVSDGKNTGAALAELRAKRLVIASELEEGKRLSSSILKRLASTDPVSCERKYKDPESFIPTHTLILYSNFAPRLGSIDGGTRRRIRIIPFNATITAGGERKNFGQVLFEQAGGAVLSWAIEGARVFIAGDFQLPSCRAVDEATERYFSANDWMERYLEECCELGPGRACGGGALYRAYSEWAAAENSYVRRGNDFAAELERRGYAKTRNKSGIVWQGLSVRLNWRAERDFGSV